jgi:hypothetical protein
MREDGLVAWHYPSRQMRCTSCTLSPAPPNGEYLPKPVVSRSAVAGERVRSGLPIPSL